MFGRFLSFVMTIALLWGSALSPAIADARDAGAKHSAEVLQIGPAASTPDDQHGNDSGKTGQVASHHHCTIAVAAEAPAVEPVTDVIREAAVPGLSRILGSLAQAPPIKPPAT